MYKLFSERIKDKNGEPEVYIYNNFSKEFRNQFYHIVNETFNEIILQTNKYDLWEIACDSFSREKGLKAIQNHGQKNNIYAFESYVDICSNEDLLDLIDYVLINYVNKTVWKSSLYNRMFIIEAIDELNFRFKQHSLGYEYTNNELIIKTNTVIHENAIKPALKLLLDEYFRGAEQEYLKAFNCYKNGDNKNAILEAIKAFESTMKTICDKLGYTYNKDKDTAKKLIGILRDNSFFPSYLESNIIGIIVTLESGAPTLRNKEAGHGQGECVVNVSDEYVEYALNLVATNMILLFKIYKQHI
ncbi:MAG: STM4504/CBY_0614 family protein [Saccharofermentanales bacterium]